MRSSDSEGTKNTDAGESLLLRGETLDLGVSIR
jgi:hypothetical protein